MAINKKKKNEQKQNELLNKQFTKTAEWYTIKILRENTEFILNTETINLF